MADPGALVGSGRAADVFEAGPGRVLRRYRPGEDGDVEAEARVMEHARRHGFPVPAVHEAHGRDLVMDRVDGPTMLADLARRPWRVREHGRLLGRLHRRLHEIPAPDGLPARLGTGDRLLHLDLHPENVMLGPGGPVVIDWSIAARGEPAVDDALTWAIMASSTVPGPLPFRMLAGGGRTLLVRAFLAEIDAGAARARLPAVAAARMELDPHLHARERRILERLAASAP